MKTVSLELAKQLHEAGIEIETEHYWAEYGTPNLQGVPPHWVLIACRPSDDGDPKHLTFSKLLRSYRAPTTDELLEYLPPVMLQSNENNCKAALRDKNSGVHIADTPADALAKLALWVKEQEK